MKKQIKYLLVGIIGLLASVSLYASPIYRDAPGFKSAELLGESIANSSYIDFDFHDVAGYDLGNFSFTASSGNVSTANVLWYLSNSTTSVGSYMATSGTPFTDFKSNICKIRLTNTTGSTVTVTGNVFFAKKGFERQLRHKASFNLSVGTTQTTANVVSETAGYWNIVASQNIFVRYAPTGNATTSDFPLFDKGYMRTDYLPSGSTIRFLASTATGDVRVIVDE